MFLFWVAKMLFSIFFCVFRFVLNFCDFSVLSVLWKICHCRLCEIGFGTFTKYFAICFSFLFACLFVCFCPEGNECRLFAEPTSFITLSSRDLLVHCWQLGVWNWMSVSPFSELQNSENARANAVPSKKDLSRHKWSLMTFSERRKSL